MKSGPLPVSRFGTNTFLMRSMRDAFFYRNFIIKTASHNRPQFHAQSISGFSWINGQEPRLRIFGISRISKRGACHIFEIENESFIPSGTRGNLEYVIDHRAKSVVPVRTRKLNSIDEPSPLGSR